MRKSVTRFQFPKPVRVIAIPLVALMAAGCSSDATRISEPMFTGSSKLFKRSGKPTSYDEIVTGSVPKDGGNIEGRSLDEPTPSSDLPRQSSSVDSGRVSSTPTAYRKGGWSSAGGTYVSVARGETLKSVSRRYGVPENEILKANKLDESAELKTGDRLLIPTYVQDQGTRTASLTATSTSKTTTKKTSVPASGVHVVSSGDTLYSIGRSYGVPRADIAAANNLTDNSTIRIGQKLRIPGKQSVAKAKSDPNTTGSVKPTRAEQAVETSSSQSAPETAAAPETESGGEAKAPSATASAAAPTKVAAVDTETGTNKRFRWPVRGRLISGFGKKDGGKHNDGINLAVPEGTSVKAADSGTVIYAGNELAGYGNLLLISHSDGWVSAYAHNRDLLVGRGDKVKRGQIVARAGSSGNVSQPQLHFELRRKSAPVDPLPYLSGA